MKWSMVTALLIGSAAACVPVTTTPSPLTPVKPLEVQLPVPPDIAFDRTAAAFIAEGYKIDQASKEGGIVKSAGVLGEVNTDAGLFGMGKVNASQDEFFFRANIVRSATGSTVYLSSTGRLRPLNGEPTPETEMYECPTSSFPGMGSSLAKCRTSLEKWKAKVAAIATRINQQQ